MTARPGSERSDRPKRRRGGSAGEDPERVGEGIATRALGRGAAGAVFFLLLFPVLDLGGTTPVARFAIAAAAALLLLAWSLRGLIAPPLAARRSRRAGLLAALVFLLALPLAPLPPPVIRTVSPQTFELYRTAWPGWPERAPFAPILGDAGAPADRRWLPASWRPLSIAPEETGDALLLGAAYAVLVLTVARFPWRDAGAVLRRGGTVLIGLGVFQAAYAFFQHSAGGQRVWWYECAAGTTCTGSYLNRNHFAGLLEMILPLVVARLAWAVTRARGVLEAQSSEARLAAFARAAAAPVVGRAMVLGGLALLIVVALGLSGSRAALLVTVAAFALALPLRPGGARLGWAVPALAAALLAAWITFPTLLPRWRLDDPTRRALTLETFDIVADFPLLGTGLGTFALVHPAYRSRTPGLWGFAIEHAHDDYVQWIAETGLLTTAVAVALVLSIAVSLARARFWRRPPSPASWNTWGLATAVLALLLHSGVDFNLHVPANALVFSFVIGSLLRCAAAAAEPRLEGAERVRGRRTARRAAALLGAALGIAWAAFAWQRWNADSRWQRVDPSPPVRSLVEPGPSPGATDRVALLGAAAGGGWRIDAALGRAVLERAADGAAAPGPSLDEAIAALVRSLRRMPAQPHAMLDLAAAVRRKGAIDAAAGACGLVRRGLALGPYDPSVRSRARDEARRSRCPEAVATRAGART